jgi:hypothetical protein
VIFPNKVSSGNLKEAQELKGERGCYDNYSSINVEKLLKKARKFIERQKKLCYENI